MNWIDVEYGYELGYEAEKDGRDSPGSLFYSLFRFVVAIILLVARLAYLILVLLMHLFKLCSKLSTKYKS